MMAIPPPTGVLARAEGEKEEREGQKVCHTPICQPGAHCWYMDAHVEFSELTLMKATKLYLGLNICPQIMHS